MKILEYLIVIVIAFTVAKLSSGTVLTDKADFASVKSQTIEAEKIVVKGKKKGTISTEMVISGNEDGASIVFWTLDSLDNSTKLFKLDSRKDGKVYINYMDKERELHEFTRRPRLLGEKGEE